MTQLKDISKKIDNKLIIRIILVIISTIIMGIGVGALVRVNMGVDPFSSMALGVSTTLNVGFGNTSLSINGLLFLLVVLFGRKQIGLGTISNMVLVGYSAQISGYFWDHIKLEQFMENIVVRICVMVVALIIFIIAASVYMAVDMGTAPYDAISIIIAEKIPVVPFKIIRMIWDFLAIVISILLGSPVGIVTIGMALLVGPAVAFVKNKLSFLK